MAFLAIGKNYFSKCPTYEVFDKLHSDKSLYMFKVATILAAPSTWGGNIDFTTKDNIEDYVNKVFDNHQAPFKVVSVQIAENSAYEYNYSFDLLRGVFETTRPLTPRDFLVNVEYSLCGDKNDKLQDIIENGIYVTKLIWDADNQ